MDKITIALDIGSGATKLVAGYVIDNKPIVLDALCAAAPHQFEGGRLADIENSAAIIRRLVIQMEKNIARKIEGVIIAMPPIGLQVYEATKTTNIISQQGLIAPLDIKNLHGLFRKESVDEQHSLLTIVPSDFEIDGDRHYNVPPLNETSDNITLTANVHFIDKTLQRDYLDLVEKAGLKLRKNVLDCHGLAELAPQYGTIPSEYVLVDIGSGLTSVTFVAAGRVYAATHFDMGAHHLTEIISQSLEVTEEEAARLHEQFGYESRENFYDGIVHQSPADPRGSRVIRQSQLNECVARFMLVWSQELARYVTALEDELGGALSLARLPWLIFGGGRKLKGFADLFAQSGVHADIRLPKFAVMGARPAQYAVALGLIYVAHKYAVGTEETVVPVTAVERVKTANRKNSYNEYDDAL